MTTYLIPYPPTTGNHQYGNRRGGGKFLVEDVIAYRQLVLLAVRGTTASHVFGGPLMVSIRACPPDNYARDHDNAEKLIYDALKKARVIKDDSNKVCKHHGWTWLDQPTKEVGRGECQVVIVDSLAGRSE